VLHDLYDMPLTLLNGTVWSFTPDGIAVEELGTQQKLLRLTIKNFGTGRIVISRSTAHSVHGVFLERIFFS
jgi:hypothetical protein